MSDDGQLKSIIERILRLHAEVKKTLRFAAELEEIMAKRSAERRPPSWKPGPTFGKQNPYSLQADPSTAVMRAYSLLSDCAALVSAANIQSFDDQEGRRSFMLACRILGLPWAHIEKAIADVGNFGIAEAARAWALYLGPTDQRIVGKVYVAATSARPGVIKIGFSKNPTARAKSLSRQHGTPIDIIHDEAGTMLHEWAIHQLLHRVSIAPEWYRANGLPRWLFPVEAGEAA